MSNTTSMGGNTFIYFSEEQARNRDFRGPAIFFVDGVKGEPMRPYWAVRLEGWRYPDVIIELLSLRTATADRTTKKDIYEQVFHTAEYYCYDPITQQLEGWQLHCGRYQPLTPNSQGWLWCDRLQLWLGTWSGALSTYRVSTEHLTERGIITSGRPRMQRLRAPKFPASSRLFAASLAVCRGRSSMPTWPDVVGDWTIRGKKSWGRTLRPGTLASVAHVGGGVGGLRAVMQIAVLAIRDTGPELPLRGTVTLLRSGHEHLRPVLPPL
jgi:Putative restriction endonuclease